MTATVNFKLNNKKSLVILLFQIENIIIKNNKDNI